MFTKDDLLRHPSQLYEAFFEGIILFLIMLVLMNKSDFFEKKGFLTASFVFFYGIFRFFIEYFREPDSQLGYYFGGTTTMGQILCILVGLFGFFGLVYSLKKNEQIVAKA